MSFHFLPALALAARADHATGSRRIAAGLLTEWVSEVRPEPHDYLAVRGATQVALRTGVPLSIIRQALVESHDLTSFKAEITRQEEAA